MKIEKIKKLLKSEHYDFLRADEHLEEGNTWGDTIWGTVDGVGENRLGKILMRVRDELNET